MPNPIIAENSKIAQEFLWKLAERECQLSGASLNEITKLDEITDFSFYGDCLVISSPDLKRGVYDTAQEFAANHNFTFKAADCSGDSWVLQMGSISDELHKDALAENINLGGCVIDKQAWKANRQYYKSI